MWICPLARGQWEQLISTSWYRARVARRLVESTRGFFIHTSGDWCLLLAGGLSSSTCGLFTRASLGFLTAKWLAFKGKCLRESKAEAVLLPWPRLGSQMASLLSYQFIGWNSHKALLKFKEGRHSGLRGRKRAYVYRCNNLWKIQSATALLEADSVLKISYLSVWRTITKWNDN